MNAGTAFPPAAACHDAMDSYNDVPCPIMQRLSQLQKRLMAFAVTFVVTYTHHSGDKIQPVFSACLTSVLITGLTLLCVATRKGV